MFDPIACSPDDAVQVRGRWTSAEEAFLVASVRRATEAAAAASTAYDQIANFLLEGQLTILQERIFGSLSARPEVMAGRAAAFARCGISAKGPVSYIEGCPTWGDGLAGVIIHAVGSGAGDGGVSIITDEFGRPCGRLWEGDGVRFLALGNLAVKQATDSGTPRSSQTREVIERANRTLRRYGMTYDNVVRTWFCLTGILEWYEEFNAARSDMYNELGLMSMAVDNTSRFPASTGIGVRSEAGEAVTLDLIAIAGAKAPAPRVTRLSNSRQKDAFLYGSAFSRAVLVTGCQAPLLEVSGTAAIDEHGQSLFPGDVAKQISHTLDSVEALLTSCGARLEDICAATAFVKRPRDAVRFWEIAAHRGLKAAPVVCVVADLCRDELLFEIDAEVVPPLRKSDEHAYH